MRNFRLGLLLISVAVLVIFIQQNLAPVLPLNFLGTKTVALPLCLWILFALVAGSLTSGVISMLWKFQLSFNDGSATGRYSRESPGNPAPRPTEPRESRGDRTQDYYGTTANREPSKATTEEDDDFEPVAQWQDDEENWVDSDVNPDVGDRNLVDDDENWIDEPIDRSPTSSRGETSSPPKTDYEVPQKPISNYQSGSVYSYSYQSPENTGVGSSESVNDAEYRVIVDPSSGSAEESLSDDDILEDDSLEADSLEAEDRSVAEPTPEPTPESTPVYTTEVQPARSAPTKIQSDNEEDDWSQPRKKNNDDWV